MTDHVALAAHARLACLPGQRHYSWLRSAGASPVRRSVGRPRGPHYGRAVRFVAGRWKGTVGFVVGANGGGRFCVSIAADGADGRRTVFPAASSVELIED